MIIILAIIIYPLWFIIIASISDSAQVTNGNVLLWPIFHLDAYRKVFADSRIMTGYRNTLFYTLFGTFLNVLATLMLAYPLSRRDLAGRNVIMGKHSCLTMFFGGGLIPTYLVYKQLGILNTVWVMVLPGLVSVYNCILMRTFIQGLPFELQEAAMIDGCGNVHMLFRVLMPLLKPILAVMVIYYGVGHWNSYFDALVYVSDNNLKPLTLIPRDILLTNTTTASEMKSGGAGESEAELKKMAEAIKYAR